MQKSLKWLIGLALILSWGTSPTAAQASCEVHTSTPTYADLTFLGVDLCDANGNLKVNIGGSGGSVLPATGNAIPTASNIYSYLMCYNTGTSLWDFCAGGLTDTDDGSIAFAQVPGLNMNESLVSDGTTWVRETVYLEDAAETVGAQMRYMGTVRRDVAASSAGTTGDNATFNTDALGLGWMRFLDPCSGVAKTHIVINISTATTTELTPSLAGASTNYYVCAIDLVAAAAQTFALTDDDSDGCGSVTSGLAGGTTAATGWSFAANGGIVKGNGEATVFKTVGTNRVLCAVTGQAAQLSGSIQVVAAP